MPHRLLSGTDAGRLRTALLVVLLAVLTAAPAARADEWINHGAEGFEPDAVTVDAGETIHFESSSGGQWSVTSDDGLFDSKTLAAQAGYSMALSVPGPHRYGSTGPGGHTATITVRGRALPGKPTDEATVRIPALPFPAADPEQLGVHPSLGVKASTTRILLGFNTGATVTQANDALEDADVRIIGGLPHLGLLLAEVAHDSPWQPFSALDEALATLRTSKAVRFAAMSPVVNGQAVPRKAEDAVEGTTPGWDWDTATGKGNWGLVSAQFPEAWNLLESVRRGKPTVITGIVDHGFEPHADLPALEIQQQLCPRGDLTCRGIDNIASEHGNHVAGIVGAAYDNEASAGRSKGVSGANPVARMYGYSTAGFSQWTDTADVGGASLVDKQLELFDLILRSRPAELRVINHSMGAASFDGDAFFQAHGDKRCNPGARDDDLPALEGVLKQRCTPNNLDEWQQEMANVGMAAAPIVREAARQGVIIVQSAGNEGDTFCPHQECAPMDAASRGEFAWVSRHWNDKGVGAPGLTNPVLVVQSHAENGLARGDSTFGGDIAAPGDKILSTVLGEGYASMSGSSMAAPYVTGLIGYLLADEPSLSVAQVRQRLLDWSNGRPAYATLDFGYTMPDKLNRDTDGDGLVDYPKQGEGDPDGFDVRLDACGASLSGAPIGTYTWSVDGQEIASTSSCVHTWRAPHEGAFSVTLTATAGGGEQDSVTKPVEVEDLLIISVGDSIASGEGDPDVHDPEPVWQLERCHRSAFGGPAQAARWIEAADAKSSVTFLHLACSGARMEGDRDPDGLLTFGAPGIGGLLTPYEGVTEDSEDSACAASGRSDLTVCEPPQLDQAKAGAGDRTPDALLVSIGANDMWFSSILTNCLLPTNDCTTSEGGSGLFETRIKLLPERYARVAQKIRQQFPDLPANRVIITQYPDVTTDENGQVDMDCGAASGISQTEADWAHTTVIPQLNFEVAKAAGVHGWTLADGIPQSFLGHGYCSSDPWIVDITETFWYQDDKNGAYHPNYAGHSSYAKAIVRKVREVLSLDTLAGRPEIDDTAPRLNAFRAVAANGPASRVADVNDPSKDGNRRVERTVTADGTVAETGDTTRSHTPGERSAPDGRVDMRDLRRYRDAWLQRCLTVTGGCPAASEIALDGGDQHVKRDLNDDGCVTGDPAGCGAAEHRRSRLDLNGDGQLDPVAKRLVPWKDDGTPAATRGEGGLMTDIDVLRAAWTGGTGAEGWSKDDVHELLRSGDVEVHADAVLEMGASKAEVQVREKGGAAIGPKRTLRRRDGFAVMTVPLAGAGQELELVTTASTDRGTMTAVSAPFSLKFGEDKLVAVCPDVSLKANPESLPADGESTSVITATVHKCGKDDEVADRTVSFTIEPASGGATIEALTPETDADGRAQAVFTAGTTATTYTVKASVPSEDGGEPLTAELDLEVVPKITVRYVWRQTIDQWRQEGTTRWGAFDPLMPDCTMPGFEYCVDRFKVGLESQTLGGIQRAGTLTGGGSRFKLTESVSNSAASSRSDWTLSFPDGETEDGGKLASWWVTDPDAYVSHDVSGVRAHYDADRIRLSGLQAIGDLPYHYALFGAMTGGSVDPLEGHSAYNGFLLVPPGSGRQIRFAAQPDEEVVFPKLDADAFKQFTSCGGLVEDLQTQRGYRVAETSEYIPGAQTLTRKTTYSPGDRPMPVGPGQLKVSYAFAAVVAFEGQPAPDPVLPDCSVDHAPDASFTVTAPGDGVAKEGRQVAFKDTSTDAENNIVSRTWDFGDGTAATGVAPHHLFEDDGTYTAELTVKDAEGNVDTATQEVVVKNEDPEADIEDVTATAGSQVRLTYRILDPGTVDKKQLTFRLSSTDELFPTLRGTDPAGVYDVGPYDQLPPGTYPLTLTVRDKDGAVARDDALLTLIGGPPPEPDPVTTPGYVTCDPAVRLDAAEREFLDLVNDYRAENGLDPVGASATLTRAADRHALDMAKNDYLAHTGADGSSPADRAYGAGYPKSAGVGENLAQVQTGFDALWAWRGSTTGHNENMLDPRWKAIGISREKGSVHRWATSYGTVQDCAATPAATTLTAAPSHDTTPDGDAAARKLDAPQGDQPAATRKAAPADAEAPIALAARAAADAEAVEAPQYPPTVAFAIADDRPHAGAPVDVANRSRDASGAPVGATFGFDDATAAEAFGPEEVKPHAWPESQYTQWYDITATAKDAGARIATASRGIRVDPVLPPWLALQDVPGQHAVAGKPYTVKVRARDDMTSEPIKGLEMTFTLGDRVVKATTDAQGIAAAAIRLLEQPGGQTIQITTPEIPGYKAGSISTYVEALENHAPVAHAGGPYTAGEGGTLMLNGGRSTDPDPTWFDQLTAFEWDLDGDGQFDDATGRLPALLEGDALSAAVCGGPCLPARDYPVELRVTDSHGDADVDSTTVRFIADFDLLLGGGTKTIVPGQTNSFAVSVIGSRSYKKPVTLSVKDLPAGVTASFSKNPVTPTDTTVLTLTGGADIAMGSYPVKVAGTDGELTKEVSDEVKVAFGLIPICKGYLTGVVTDKTTGAPIAGADVQASGYWTRTDASGRYEIEDVPLGWNNAPSSYTLQGVKDGYWNGSGTGEATCGGVGRIDIQMLDVRKGKVHGTVIDKDTRKPIKNAVVTGYQCGVYTCRWQKLADVEDAGASWTYEPTLGTNNSERHFSARAEAPGYWYQDKGTTIAAGTDPALQHELIKQCTATVYGGKVVYADTGEPAPEAGVGVYLSGGWSPDLTLKTDATGSFVVDRQVLLAHNNEPTAVRAVPTAPEDAPAGTKAFEGWFRLQECGQKATVTLTLKAPKPNYGAIDGYVTDEETTLPMADAWVQVGSQSVRTDDKGYYTFPQVHVGDDGNTSSWATVKSSPSGYYEASASKTVNAGQTTRIDLKVLRKRTGAVNVKVTDSVTGAPIPGAMVQDWGCGSICIYTGRDGAGSRTGLALGSRNAAWQATLTATATGYWPQVKTATISATSTPTVEYQLQPGCEPARVSGTVVNAEDGTPIHQATITGGQNGAVSSDQQGRFEITDIKPGTGNNPRQVTLTASHPQFYSQSKTITVFCGARINVEFGSRTSKSGTIVGTVTDGDLGKPLADAFVGTASGATTKTDSSGNYRIQNVPLADLNADREWQVLVQPAGYKARAKTVVVKADAESRLDFVFSGANAAPAATSQSVTLDEDSQKGVPLAGTDADGDALTYHVMRWPEHGTLSGKAPNLTYKPDANYAGPDSFEFLVNDSVASSAKATVSIDVAPVDDAPVARDDYFDAEPDTTTRFPVADLLGNDTDADGDRLAVTRVASRMTGATVTLDGDAVVFTPPAGYTQDWPVAFIDYTVSDGEGPADEAMVFVKVKTGPAAPRCADRTFTLAKGQTLSEAAACTDKNGDPLTYALVAGPQTGTLDFKADGAFTYALPADFVGTAQFTVKASDGALESEPATIRVVVTPENRAPVCADATVTGEEDAPVELTLTCADADGDPLTFDLGQPAHGALRHVAGRTYRYTPAADWSGEDAVTFRARDGAAQSGVATARVVIAARNDLPVCQDVTLTVDAPAAAEHAAACADVDGDALAIEIAAQGEQGTASVAGGALRYAPKAGATGQDAFAYVARDGSGASAPARATVTINAEVVTPPPPPPPPPPVNTAPVASDDEVKTPYGKAVAIPVASLLANDRDPDGDRLTLTGVSGASDGAARLAAGAVTFTPARGFSGVARFRYMIADGRGGTHTATVVVLVGSLDAEELLLGCEDRPIVLLDVVPDGRTVRLSGIAEKRFAGERVTIRFQATGKVVAHATLGADGRFATTAPMPAKKLRAGNDARYVATVAGEQSRALKLMRRLLITSVSVVGGDVVLAGRVTGALARKAKDRVIEVRRETCADYEVVGRVMPDKGGRFRVRVAAPRDGKGAIYRLQGRVRQSPKAGTLFETFSLPRVVR